MLNIIFFTSLGFCFAAMILQFAAAAFKKQGLKKAAWIVFIVSFIILTAYIVIRGIKAHRVPLSNQFEFAAAFAWCIALLLLILHLRFQADWITTAAIPMVFLILSYAALQPKNITELMPALRSAWFGLHIGSAALSYACFILAGSAGLRYLLAEKKQSDPAGLEKMDYMSYRLITLGFMLLTVTIVSGAIWAEQAWSAFWTWDPKEVWALITWILYAVYLHLRLMRKKNGKFMAWYSIIAIPVVLFTFIGVNTLLPGLHSYG